MSNTLVTVIIPVYNEERAIEACLTSLLKQQDIAMEVIIVDDGSIDSSKLKIKSQKSLFESAHRRFLLLEETHQGPGRARNVAAAEARGNILVFVDADMTFAPDFV